jgi:centromeric protein E
MEVYNEKVRDLLNVDKSDLKVYETQEGNISTDCSLEMVNCAEQMVHLLNQGNKNKSIGETQMNDRSSRSHTIFRIVSTNKKIFRVPHLNFFNFVDDRKPRAR